MALKSAPKPSTSPIERPVPKPGEPGAETTGGEELRGAGGDVGVIVEPVTATRTLRVSGNVPPELWNRFGNRLLPKVRSNSSLKLKVDFSLEVAAEEAGRLQSELRQALGDLGLKDAVHIETG